MGHIIGLNHQCTACYQDYFTLQIMQEQKGILVNTYPYAKNRYFNPLIMEMTPRFVELYAQAQTVEQINRIDLAGMGYRASLEVLIKDYALYFELDSKEGIATKNLNNAIDKYFNSDSAITSADVVRKLGNDYAHWEKEHQNLPLEILKAYLEIFIKQIEVKLML